MNRWLAQALRYAKTSPHPKHKMAALVVRGGHVVSKAVNLHRWGRCAERRALRPHLDLAGATVFVVRTNRKVSKPCVDCQKALRASHVFEVVYFSDEGKVVRERV